MDIHGALFGISKCETIVFRCFLLLPANMKFKRLGNAKSYISAYFRHLTGSHFDSPYFLPLNHRSFCVIYPERWWINSCLPEPVPLLAALRDLNVLPFLWTDSRVTHTLGTRNEGWAPIGMPLKHRLHAMSWLGIPVWEKLSKIPWQIF